MSRYPTGKCGYCGHDSGSFYEHELAVFEPQCSDCYNKGLDWIKKQPPAVEKRISEDDIEFCVRKYDKLLGGCPLCDIIRQYQSDITQQREQIRELTRENSGKVYRINEQNKQIAELQTELEKEQRLRKNAGLAACIAQEYQEKTQKQNQKLEKERDEAREIADNLRFINWGYNNYGRTYKEYSEECLFPWEPLPPSKEGV